MHPLWLFASPEQGRGLGRGFFTLGWQDGPDPPIPFDRLEARVDPGAIVVQIRRSVTVTKTVRKPRGMARAAAALLALTAATGGNQDIGVPSAGLSLASLAPTVSVSANQTIAVPTAGLTLAAAAPTIVSTANKFVAVPSAGLSLAGNAPTVSSSANQTVSVPAAGLSLAANAPTISSSANQTVAVPAAGLALAALAPTVVVTADDGFLQIVRKRQAPRFERRVRRTTSWVGLTAPANNTISVPAAALALAGLAPTISNGAGVVISVPTAGLSLAALAPTVDVTQDLLIPPRYGVRTVHQVKPRKLSPRWLLLIGHTLNQTVSVPTANLALGALAPTVVATGNQTVAVPVAGLALQGNAPTVQNGANQTIAVPAAALTLAANAPTISSSANRTIAVPAAGLSLAGLAPTVASTANQFVAVPSAALALVAYAPTVVAGLQVTDPAVGDTIVARVTARVIRANAKSQLIIASVPPRVIGPRRKR